MMKISECLMRNVAFSHHGCCMMALNASYSTIRRKTFDYVIVGAGSAGCVLANRLSAPKQGTSATMASNQRRVHLIEAGPNDKTWTIDMPAALMYNLEHDKYNWYYNTTVQKHMNNRIMYCPRGRVLGGSSAINAMVYVRGHPLDYDRWVKEGATGWSYAHCLPYFKRAQTHELGENEYRGGSGPLYVSRGKTNHPLHHAWIEAAQQAGYPFTEDMNGYQQEGVGYMDMTIKDGVRCSASKAYLHPILPTRANLSLDTNSLVTRILFEKTRAIGVEYIKNKQTYQALAEKEVILSGGAINSPQLLMLSGIGDPDHLRSVGIEPWHELRGVGQNLQDHLEIYVQQACKKPITLYSAQWKFPHNMVKIGLQWFLFKRGWGATAHLESGGFIRSNERAEHPNLQFHFLPSTVNDHGRKVGPCHAFQVHVGPMRPLSSGQVLLASNDPTQYPIIDPNYLAASEDRSEFRECIRLSREIFNQPAIKDNFSGIELAPGGSVQSDQEIDAFVRRLADTAYHPACTCRMGNDPHPRRLSESLFGDGYLGNGWFGAAVTKPNCSVWGLESLRVVDASIMPSSVSGNLNAPVIMMAEMASAIILKECEGEDAILPPSVGVPIWRPEHPDKQRDGVIKHT